MLAENSSSLHFRKKRMLEPTFIGQQHDSNRGFIYIVKILLNMKKLCAGVIVSTDYILAPVVCFIQLPNMVEPHTYTVISGAPHLYPIQFHDASDPYTRLIKYQLILVRIEPYISLANPSLNRQVILTDEKDLPPHSIPSVLAWDSHGDLRKITQVLIVARPECMRFYSNYNRPISNSHICTAQMHGLNHLSHEDHGSALVIGDTLYGVLVYPGSLTHQNAPDIFARVNGEYYTWIMEHTGRQYNLQRMIGQVQSLNHRLPQQHMPNQGQSRNHGWPSSSSE